MKEIFEKRHEKRVTRDRYKLKLNIPKINQVTFGGKSLKFYIPKIWNILSVNIKTAENVNAFKNLIKKVEWRFMQLHCLHSSIVWF